LACGIDLNPAASTAILLRGDCGARGAAVNDYVSLAEMLGYDPAAMWTLAWTLFFVRLALGFAVGIDDVVQSFQKNKDPRAIHRANNVVTALHIAMLAAFVLAAPFIPA
jgi:hypothetical protein